MAVSVTSASSSPARTPFASSMIAPSPVDHKLRHPVKAARQLWPTVAPQPYQSLRSSDSLPFVTLQASGISQPISYHPDYEAP